MVIAITIAEHLKASGRALFNSWQEVGESNLAPTGVLLLFVSEDFDAILSVVIAVVVVVVVAAAVVVVLVVLVVVAVVVAVGDCYYEQQHQQNNSNNNSNNTTTATTTSATWPQLVSWKGCWWFLL